MMLREARKDENVRGSAERTKGLREEYSKLSLHRCRYTGKYRGQDAVLLEDSACTDEMQTVNDRGISSYLLFAARANPQCGATPRLFAAETRWSSRVKGTCNHKRMLAGILENGYVEDGYIGHSRE